MAKSFLLRKHYQRALSQWPLDILRPDLSFQTAMERRINLRFGTTPTSPPHPPSFNETSELQQLNVLYSFLENRYLKKYPLSDTIMKPVSNPTYYEDLREELDEAPTRGWWAGTLSRWKGFLRFS